MNPSSIPMSDGQKQPRIRVDLATALAEAYKARVTFELDPILDKLEQTIQASVAQHTKDAVEQADATNELLTAYFRLKAENKAIRTERNEYMAHNHCLTEDAGGDCISKLRESEMGHTLCDVCEKRNDWFIRRQVISHQRSAIMRKLKRLAELAAAEQKGSRNGKA